MMYLHDLEPYYGWLSLYSTHTDPNSPFHEVEHNQFYYDRSINNIPAHPQWDTIGSESLLLKILYANYLQGYAIIELFGEWNDLFDNDFKLLAENCLTFLIDAGIKKFILLCENVFHVYLDADDYYQALSEELEDEGWVFLLRARPNVLAEFEAYGISSYFMWSPTFDELRWRKLKPTQLYQLIDASMQKLLP